MSSVFGVFGGVLAVCSAVACWLSVALWREDVCVRDYFEISRVVFIPNITYKSCYYLFILLLVKGL